MPYNQILLSSIYFDEVIVHTLPKHKKDESEIEPRYSETVSPLSIPLISVFKDKIVSALAGDKMLKLLFDEDNPSPIATFTKLIIKEQQSNGKSKFVNISKKIAKHLFDTQKGNNNEGILVVIPVKVNQNPALVLIKLEMDSGAQLVMNDAMKSFDIKAIEDLMMTKKTRVYKVALLLNRDLQGVEFDAIVTDNQIDMKAKKEVSSWFINRFLGCKPYKDPKIVTQDFYNFTKAFIDMQSDDVIKAKYHQDLNSYLTKNISRLNPKEFADDYLLTTEERNGYRDFLKTKGFSFNSFNKDLTQIENKVRKMAIEFANGVVITSNSGRLEDKVILENAQDGQTKATITSKVRKIK